MSVAYLSEGLISALKIKKQEFEKKTINNSEITSGIIDLTSSEKREYIVRCVEIRHIEYEFFLVFLCDNDQTFYAIVDENHFTETSSIKRKDTTKFELDVNSILIINKIGFAKKTEFSSALQSRFCDDDSITFFILRQATVIGYFNENMNEKECCFAQANYKDVIQKSIHDISSNSMNRSYDRLKTTKKSSQVLISNLNINLNKIGDFEMKLWLSDKTDLNLFTKDKKYENSRIRFKFKDTSGFIEAVAYYKIAEKHQHLKVNKCYLIRNIFLNPVQLKGRAWAAQSSSSIYDIIINSETIIEILNDEIIEPVLNSNIYRPYQKSQVPVVFVPIKSKNLLSNQTLLVDSSEESEDNEEIIITSSTKRLVSSISNISISNFQTEKKGRNEFDELELYATSTQITTTEGFNCKNNNSINPKSIIFYTPLNRIHIIQLNNFINIYGFVTRLESDTSTNYIHLKDLTQTEVIISMSCERFNILNFTIGNVITLTNVRIINTQKNILLSLDENTSVMKINNDTSYDFYLPLVNLFNIN
jgi:hypothetical protein